MKFTVTLMLICLIFIDLTAKNVDFKVTLDSNQYIVDPGKYNGRLFILLQSDTTNLALYWPNPSNPQPAFALDIKDFKLGETVTIDGNAINWKHSLDELEGYYSVSALMDIDTTLDHILAPGNLVSEKQVIYIDKKIHQTFSFELKYPIQPYPFNETENIKEIKVKSQLLSSFYQEPTYITGAIILPESYNISLNKTYPVVFVFPGWGGNRFHIVMGDFQQKRYGMSQDYGEEKIFVFMDQQCRWGYHVFADSENNGPRGTSFVNEFIPYLEKNFRTNGNRFLTGQSSGAWASLWLQINYPEQFDGTWATSPDPIDFRSFENFGNIYDPDLNFYFNRDGTHKPHSKKNGEATNTHYDYFLMENIYGEGYQFGSYESVFGKQGIDRKPERIFDRMTGKIYANVATNWRKYDLRYILEHAGSNLLKKIQGKIHIYVANDDDYFLDLGVKGFKQITDKLPLKIEIRFYEGLGHNVWTDELRKEIHHNMDQMTK